MTKPQKIVAAPPPTKSLTDRIIGFLLAIASDAKEPEATRLEAADRIGAVRAAMAARVPIVLRFKAVAPPSPPNGATLPWQTPIDWLKSTGTIAR